MKLAYSWISNKQEEIARAKSDGDLKRAEELGEELVHSNYAQTVAVQTVANNVGSRSPGLSKESFKTNYQNMVFKLNDIVTDPKSYSSSEAAPLGRIYIKKKDGILRPINIPSYTDRCLQALYKMAVEPFYEEMADISLYGFRPIRGVSWAVGRTLNAIKNPWAKYSFVVEVDIMGCFDNIDHDFIRQITPVIPRHILDEWLNCGYIEREGDKVLPTEAGVPKGGILSPLLANLALDGLETHIRERIKQAKTGSKGSGFCRYADDMVIFVTTYKNAVVALEAVKELLIIRGLQVKEAKTSIINIHDSSFDFVGFTFSLVFRHNMKRKVARISIPKLAIRKFRDKINLVFKSNKAVSTKIREANSVIRGWANAYKIAHDSHLIFNSLRYWIWKQYFTMCFRKLSNSNPKANKTRISKMVWTSFFTKLSNGVWPATKDKNDNLITLVNISSIEFPRPILTNKA